MYAIRTTSAVKKDITKLDRSVRKAIVETHLPNIQADPRTGQPLHHHFKGLWSYHFSYHRVAYRIIYEIDEGQQIVILLLIGSRERVYQQLRRRMGS